MFGDGALTFHEFMTGELLPLARIHDAVLKFLKGRDDAVLYGAQAVNAYVDAPRMTADVDIVSPRAAELAEELRAELNERFQIAVCVREVKEGLGYRLYQVQKPNNRHLVDVRAVAMLPPAQRIEEVLVVTPVELIAGKVLACARRFGRPKSFLDRRDLAELLLAFPELKSDTGAVRERLEAMGADRQVLALWSQLAAEEILPEEDDGF